MTPHESTSLRWLPIEIDGLEGTQTFFYVEQFLCRAVYMPARNNLWLTVELPKPVPEPVLASFRQQIKDADIKVDIKQEQKLLFKYDNVGADTSAGLRNLVILLKAILASIKIE